MNDDESEVTVINVSNIVNGVFYIILYSLALIPNIWGFVDFLATIASWFQSGAYIFLTLVVLMTPFPKMMTPASIPARIFSLFYVLSLAALFYFNGYIIQLGFFVFCEFIMMFIVPAINKQALKEYLDSE